MLINTAKTSVVLTITKGNKTEIFTRDIFFPEDLIMQNLIGDGLAKVSMTMEKSDKNYGNGVSVSATITLTVNQDEEVVAEAFQTLKIILAEEVGRALEEARSL